MTGRERVLAALRGEPQDRRAVVPIVGQAAARLCGMTVRAHASDPARLAGAQLACARRFGYDGVYIAADTWVNAEAVGLPGVFQPEDAPAEGHGGWIRSEEDLARLSLPDPARAGRWPSMVEAVRIAAREADGAVAVIGNFDQSPYSLACELRGLEAMMIDIVDAPEFARALLEFCARAVSRYAIALARAGADVLNTGDSPACPALIGVEAYEAFALPYEKSVFEEIRREVDVPITLHVCGDATAGLASMVESGADGIELDAAVDLTLARRILGDRATAIGNVGTIDPLLRGTPEDVRGAARACLEAFAGSDRFILSTGCAIPPATPPENIAALVEAARGSGGP
ncbi:MAG: uroporphyrinogen decarboxylase family protein [Planctomycetes bacterium]|nr:uroporphyrinogen decarboxylase family protein [Planctomycetota bacterium]